MIHRGLMLIAGVVLLAGCGTETAAPPASTTTTTTTTTTTPTTTITTAAPFAAADGTNLEACADGVCEVFVKTGDSLPNASGAPVQITVQNGQVTLLDVSDSGFSSSLSGGPGMPQVINNQVFLIVAVQGEQGLLRLSLR